MGTRVVGDTRGAGRMSLGTRAFVPRDIVRDPRDIAAAEPRLLFVRWDAGETTTAPKASRKTIGSRIIGGPRERWRGTANLSHIGSEQLKHHA